jgi:hypothetical protein
MKKLLFTFLSLIGCVGYGQNVAFDGHTWEAPYTLPTPTGWGIERFLVPPAFAPSLTYKGVEDIRFSPGWAKQDSEEYWSYAFLWYLTRRPALTAASIEKELKAYYTGLIQVNTDSATLAAEPPLSVKAKFRQAESATGDEVLFTGSVTLIDYMTRKPITLNCLVRSIACMETDKEIMFFELSPQPFKHKIWQSLDQIWSGFRCQK